PPRTASPFGTGPHCPPYTPTQCGPVDSHAVRMRSAWTALAGGATITEEAARHSHYPFAFSWAARRSLQSAAVVKNMVPEALGLWAFLRCLVVILTTGYIALSITYLAFTRPPQLPLQFSLAAATNWGAF